MSEEEDLERLARRLAAADFSAESKIRATLRASLLAGGRSGRATPRALRTRTLVFVSAAAALAALMLYPARPKTTPPSAPAPVAAAVAARTTPPAPPAPAAVRPRAAAQGFPKDSLGLPILPGRLAERKLRNVPSPFSSRVVASVFVKRRITLGDIFEERKSL